MAQDDGVMQLMPKGSITNAPKVSKSTKALPPEERAAMAAARKAAKGTGSGAKGAAASKSSAKAGAAKGGAKASGRRRDPQTVAKTVKGSSKTTAKPSGKNTSSREPRTGIGRWWHRLQNSPDRVTLAMSIVALGVVYGDIGTSPLYTFQTFIAGQGGIAKADRPAVLGMLSLIFWSITLITTVKYVLIAMRIDNRGEGGIFALYSLVRRYGKWLAIPAMVGGAAFLADSVLTPAVSISSAVEGLKTLAPLQPAFQANQNLSLMITVVIILVLFAIQSRGTERIGKVFGLVVMVWFGFLAAVGAVNLSNDWTVLEALNPIYGIEFLFSPHNAAGLTVMGTVFLSTTGAEALYSDMGHVGRGNIYFTWPFIKVALVFNYFGQGAWIMANDDDGSVLGIGNLNPFFQMMDPNVRYVAVALSVAAGVIASQALITGAFSMVSEATGLNWMPHLQIRYPARTRGQLYIPAINLVLCVSTLVVLAIFKDSEHIAAAYGLALTITMITTTVLLAAYIWNGWHKRFGAIVFTVVFLAIQIMFFLASMAKFLHGGWFTMLLTLAILYIMYTWDQGTKVERSQRRHMSPDEFLPALDKLHGDFRFPYYADNVVYMTSDSEMRRLDTDIFFSIFADHPKRARAWWAVSVQTTDDPYTREYSVENFGTEYLFRVRMRLGFKVDQNVATYLHQIMHELIDAHELPQQKTIYPKLDEDPEIGTIRYVLIHKALLPESKITSRGAFSLKFKYAIRRVAGSPAQWFGLAPYNPVVEVLPLFVSTVDVPPLKRTSLRKPKRPITLKEIFEEQQLDAQSEAQSAERKAMEAAAQAAAAAAKAAAAAAAAAKLPQPVVREKPVAREKPSAKSSRSGGAKAAAQKAASSPRRSGRPAPAKSRDEARDEASAAMTAARPTASATAQVESQAMPAQPSARIAGTVQSATVQSSMRLASAAGGDSSMTSASVPTTFATVSVPSDAVDEETTTVMAPIAAPRPVKSAPMPAVPVSSPADSD